MADALAAGYNIFNAVWLQGPGAAQIERLTVDWLRQIFGLPRGRRRDLRQRRLGRQS